ncbi:right-handed parallel beta-helix repeat-containing protein [Glaciecola sp. KUL10]|uniref:right-handed parallel beta-helix repeat-containing protein n=1 Tax=Glaciecola sp. (strain KUL10) TaxID=2161813 RepID=UPI000D7872DE|nr:right-handed parallel beta-helix repeat-containing protein [Glaciecola sp. KUL10]GBL04572.1 fibronectin type III domain protein [Glaciecola sp. KUL10]
MNIWIKKFNQLSAYFVFLLILSACNSLEKSKDIVNEAFESNKQLPQRIAVLPFVSEEETKDNIKTMLRESVYSHLSSTNYLFVRPQKVTQSLAVLDYSTLNQYQSNVSRISNAVDADALLLGEILSADVIYAGVAAQVYYEVQVSLVAKTGELLWQDTFSERSLEGGVSADPFSMLYSLAVTAMHVGEENLFAVADKIGRQVAKAIPQPAGAFETDSIFIGSVIHNASNTILSYGDELKIGIEAPSGLNVSATIETIDEVFSLQEVTDGKYMLALPVSNQWNGKDLMLTGFAIDSTGNRARKISTVGLLTIDNLAPEPINGVEANLTQSSATFSWQANEPFLTYTIFSKMNGKREQLISTTDTQFTIARPHVPFERYQFEIVATDSAGNASEANSISAVYLPNNAMREASPLTLAKIPALIDSDLALYKSYNPYILDLNSTVVAGASLFIEPGVTIQFTQGATLEINGSLYTFGGEPISFEALNKRLNDQTFIKLNTSAHVEINSFIVDSAGIAIEVLEGRPMLSNCQIINSKYSALSIKGVANVSMENCIINGSNTSAIVVTQNARLKIRNSQFLNNMPFHIQNSSTYTVDARLNQWRPAADMISILGKVDY